MTEEGLERLRAEVAAQTGVDWQVLLSHRVGRGSHMEMYAFLFRPDRVTWVEGAVVYIDDRDAFAREPFSAVFRTHDGLDFVLTSVHVIYGKTVEGRQREAEALAEYRLWLEESFPGLPIYVAGDFNLPPTDPAWREPGRASFPLIREGATTLSSHDGRYANLYDNIWAPVGIPLPLADTGIDLFPQTRLGISHETARATVSDHAPVFMVLDPAADPVVLEPWSDVLSPEPRPEKRRGPEFAAALDTPLSVGGAAVAGNIRSSIYHLSHCPGYRQMAERNKVMFDTEAEAVAAGYRMAKNC
ncbi:MAG: DNAse [Alphaproteobacteria bacterium]|nr:DNAse [Alphaproteobacteria bacterium]